MSTWIEKARQWARDGTGRSVRRLQGVALRPLAWRIGISKSALHAWETSQRTPTGEPAERWARWIEANLKEVTP